MKDIFVRSTKNPIILPDKNNGWEAKKVYNPGAIYYQGKYHLFYRAMDSGRDWHSSIGYADSRDGETVRRFKAPVLAREHKYEFRGLEDPRLTKIGNTFYMAYAAYDGRTPRLCIATSRDLKTWTKHGPALDNWKFASAGGVKILFRDGRPVVMTEKLEWSKSGAIFPEKINGKYRMLFGEYRLWWAESNDLIHWQAENKPFLKPRAGKYFDNLYVETGPPPIKTEQGWLVLYHGIDKKFYYRLGYLLLDLKNPTKIIKRSQQAIFEPQREYEFHGLIDIAPGGIGNIQPRQKPVANNYIHAIGKRGCYSQVVFCPGAVLKNGKLRIFYGAGDTSVCTAEAKLKDILNAK